MATIDYIRPNERNGYINQELENTLYNSKNKEKVFRVLANYDKYDLKEIINEVKKVDINVKDPYTNWTPLHYAAYIGNSSLILSLLSMNSNPSIRDANKLSALDIYVQNPKVEISTIIAFLCYGNEDSNELAKQALEYAYEEKIKNFLKDFIKEGREKYCSD
ncbi:MAG: ankyrin repeat domain-containing protein [Candidatus Aenigmatarchaeota archaeon]